MVSFASRRAVSRPKTSMTTLAMLPKERSQRERHLGRNARVYVADCWFSDVYKSHCLLRITRVSQVRPLGSCAWPVDSFVTNHSPSVAKSILGNRISTARLVSVGIVSRIHSGNKLNLRHLGDTGFLLSSGHAVSRSSDQAKAGSCTSSLLFSSPTHHSH